MLLNTFKRILWGSLTGSTSLALTTIDGTVVNSYAIISGNSPASFTYDGGNTSSYNVNAHEYKYYSLTFGSGTTEPTADDYQMESPYDTTNHFSWEACTQSSVINASTKTIIGTITNISEEDLTVSEIGVVAMIKYSANNNVTLIARSLITPVTIEPDETKTFQYTLDLSGIAG